jgi:hypothetical protein
MSAAPPRLVSLAQHPRAAGGIRRAKAWGGLGGLFATAGGSLLQGAPLFDALLWALVGGVAGYLLVWAAAIAVWRAILQAEARAAAARLAERRRKAAS